MLASIRHFLHIIFSLLFLLSCTNDKSKILMDEELLVLSDQDLILQWNKGYEDDSLSKSVIGLEWALSHIGALNTQSIYQMISGDKHIFLDINQLGFSKEAKKNLKILHRKLKNTEEYKKQGAIDMGRYVTLLIGSSEHYYRFVELPENYFDLLAQYKLKEEQGFIDNSIITKGHRVIKFSEQIGLNQFFVAEEVDENTGKLIEYETIDLMPNGQVRFGIYDENGDRKNSTDPLATEAGKPGKCMWCHESRIQPLFTAQQDFTNFLTFQELSDTLSYYRYAHVEERKSITTNVNYSKKQDHAFMELLYITFTQPSAERLSLEWGITINEVEERLKKLSPNIHPEFGAILGATYSRMEVDEVAPFKALSVSSSVREKALIEVNHLD